MNNDAYAYGIPFATGNLKASPTDFIVEEQLGFELTGDGEHLFLYVEKTGLNTEELVKALSRVINKPVKAISYAGLKDRQALTRQWLSVHCPGEAIEQADSLQGVGWRVLKSNRHLKKLKIGALASNAFTIKLREISDLDAVNERLEQIKIGGVPNYFGPQRFGHQGQNIEKARAMLLDGYKVKDRFLKGMYYSAARSFLFNRLLNARVLQQNWHQALPGDVMQLAGTSSIFAIGLPDETIHQRIRENDISPAAPLWGKGEERASLDSLLLQDRVLSEFQPWLRALVAHGLERSYRSLILVVDKLTWSFEEQVLKLQFILPPGCYATSVIRELMLNALP